MTNLGKAIVRLLASAVISVSAVYLILRFTGSDPANAIEWLGFGAFGNISNFGNSVTETIPLLLTGLGVAVAFRAQLWNVGGEGQFLIGALAVAAVGQSSLSHLPSPLLIGILLIAGTFAGALWSGIAGWMRVARDVPEVISTIMLNFIASELLSYLAHGPLQQKDMVEPATVPLPETAHLPIVIAGTTVHAGLWIGLAAVLAIAILLNRTRWGFAIRVLGANPIAAAVNGIDVKWTRLTIMFVSGGLCGLAGAVQLCGSESLSGQIFENYAPGYGFTAVAVALLARLNPIGIIASAFFFGAMTAGSGTMERHAGVSSVLSMVVEGIVLIVLLASQWVHWEPSTKAGSEDRAEAALPSEQ